MSKIPQTWTEARALGLKGLWLYSRVHLLFLVIGALVTITTQLLTGFWAFREQHQETIATQYAATLKADEKFEAARRKYETVFVGDAAETELSYSEVARDYIQSIGAIQSLLPSTRDEYENYVRAIANLQKFYGETSPPKTGSIDATIFYGEYRVAYDEYVDARHVYLGEIASEAGSYQRYLSNS